MTTPLEPWAPAVRVLTRPFAVERPMPRIRVLRVITVVLIAEMIGLGIILLFLVDLTGSFPSGWLYGWMGITALSFSVGFYTRAKRNEHFVRSANAKFAYPLYRTRLIMGLALAEVPFLAGFLIAFPADSMLPYLLGAIVSAVKVYQVAPTTADVETLQKWIDQYQDPIDLASLLMEKGDTR